MGNTGEGENGDRYWGTDFIQNGQPLTGIKGKYGPDILNEFVVDFILRHREHPFFIYDPMTLIHGTFKPTPATKPGVTDRNSLHTDMIAYTDILVGKLITELDKMNLREKTLVVFVGDNGSVDLGTIHGRMVDGVKHELNEGGSRVPRRFVEVHESTFAWAALNARLTVARRSFGLLPLLAIELELGKKGRYSGVVLRTRWK